MSRTLEPTLLSLIPTHNAALPQPLLELASSLLAQSRHSASTLKTEEEVARSYACAHIACERLKVSLDLPPIKPRPPIPPRIYNRLYTHLDNVLPANFAGRSGRVRTPSSKMRESDIFGSAQRIPSRGTPNKDESLAKFRSPAVKGDSTPTRSTGKQPPRIPAKRKAGGVASTLPAWIRPTIQFMCQELDDERIGRSALAGMQTIAAPQGRRSKDEWVNQNLTPLLAGVYFLLWSQLYVLEQGKQLDDKQYGRMRKNILKVLNRAQQNVTVKTMDEDELWIGWADIRSRDFDTAVDKIVESEWQNEEWFQGVRHLVKTSGVEEDDEAEGAEMEGDDRIGEKLHVQRGDTMFQSRWTMTDQKRREYQAWKNGIMQQIEEIERSQGTEMEVDAAA